MSLGTVDELGKLRRMSPVMPQKKTLGKHCKRTWFCTWLCHAQPGLITPPEACCN